MISNRPIAPPVGQRLAGRKVAVSISLADDQDRMGLAPDHMDHVLQSVLVPLVSEGAVIAYGGRIEHDHNYTLIISNQLGEAYRRMEQRPGHRPFVHFLARHRFASESTPPARLLTHLQALAPYGELWVTGRDGVLGAFAAGDQQLSAVAACRCQGFSDDATIELTDGSEALSASQVYREIAAQAAPEANESFTHMRMQMARACDARVQVGGRSSGFSGPISGLCEEALLTIAARRMLLVLGGFGGASRDIAIALGLLDPREAVPPQAAPDRDRYETGLAQLRAVRSEFETMYAAETMQGLRELAGTESLVDAAQGLSRLLIEGLE